MAREFGRGVSDAQARLARRFEAAGICSYSQAIKAFQRRNHDLIDEWMDELDAKQTAPAPKPEPTPEPEPEPEPKPVLLTAKEAAAALGVSLSTVYRRARAGRFSNASKDERGRWVIQL